jgi:hypothetical protein
LTRFDRLGDDELVALLPADSYDQGWGASCTIVVDGEPVFLKRLPLTDVEVEHPRSTRSWFRLPPWYSYGVGSAGFGSWREVAGHELTTGAPGFPTLLHTRVMARTAAPRVLPWSGERYVDYWRGNAAIGRYMAARDAATHEVWVLLEHVPMTGGPWLFEHQDRVDDLLTAAFENVDRLAERGIVHFDSHLNNVVTDGTRFLLTDFGLVMADDFELSAAERRFLDRHRHYDRGIVAASLGQLLMGHLGQKTAKELARTLDDPPAEIGPELRAACERYRAPMLYMVDHFARMMRPTKRSRYDDAELAALF